MTGRHGQLQCEIALYQRHNADLKAELQRMEAYVAHLLLYLVVSFSATSCSVVLKMMMVFVAPVRKRLSVCMVFC